MKNWKNHPKKLLRIGPDHFFPLTSQGHSPQPKIDFPYHEISGPDICSLICGENMAVQWQKYAVIYVVIYCQDTLGLTLKMQ